MFKITAIISLILIGSTLWAASLSCDSCGSECASACGTRHFRSCCFNYLRRKRGPDDMKLLTNADFKQEIIKNDKTKLPFYVIETLPEQWLPIANEYNQFEFSEKYDA